MHLITSHVVQSRKQMIIVDLNFLGWVQQICFFLSATQHWISFIFTCARVLLEKMKHTRVSIRFGMNKYDGKYIEETREKKFQFRKKTNKQTNKRITE